MAATCYMNQIETNWISTFNVLEKDIMLVFTMHGYIIGKMQEISMI